MGGEPGPWRPQIDGGRRWRVLSRVLIGLGAIGLVVVAAVGTTGLLLVQQTEANLTRVAVPELEQSATPNTARHFLVVGSDARDGLADSDRAELSLGSFDGQRSDTIIYVVISEDRNDISLVSLPRDLLVVDGDRQRKLTDTFDGGPDHLVRIIRENFGLPVNHYAQVSLGGFIEVVRALGGVEICLEEPLVDRKSGADFEAGCHQMSPQEALSYVRSREGDRYDFDRMERQQTFLRSVIVELTSARMLVDPVRLFRLVDEVSGNITTDENLGVGQVRGLADEVRQVVRSGMPMATVPAYPRRIDNIEYMIRYGPGADAMFDDLRSGRPLPDRGSSDERDETVVALYSGGRGTELDIVHGTLHFAGFQSGGAGTGPSSTDAGQTTTVFALPGEQQRAAWVAATLGAPIRPLPEDVTPPSGAHVVVGVGTDASR